MIVSAGKYLFSGKRDSAYGRIFLGRFDRHYLASLCDRTNRLRLQHNALVSRSGNLDGFKPVGCFEWLNSVRFFTHMRCTTWI